MSTATPIAHGRWANDQIFAPTDHRGREVNARAAKAARTAPRLWIADATVAVTAIVALVLLTLADPTVPLESLRDGALAALLLITALSATATARTWRSRRLARHVSGRLAIRFGAHHYRDDIETIAHHRPDLLDKAHQTLWDLLAALDHAYGPRPEADRDHWAEEARILELRWSALKRQATRTA